MPTQPYPRATLRKIIKAHANSGVSKNVDVLVYLDYVLFVQELMKEAGIKARERGSASVGPRDVRKVSEMTLRKFRG